MYSSNVEIKNRVNSTLQQTLSCLESINLGEKHENTANIKKNRPRQLVDNIDASLLLDMAQTASCLSHQLIRLYNQLSTSKTPGRRTRRLTPPLSSGYNSARNTSVSSRSSLSSSSSSSLVDTDLSSIDEFECSLVRGRLVFEDIEEKEEEEETPARYGGLVLTGVKRRHDQAAKSRAREIFEAKKIKYSSSVVKSLEFS